MDSQWRNNPHKRPWEFDDDWQQQPHQSKRVNSTYNDPQIDDSLQIFDFAPSFDIEPSQQINFYTPDDEPFPNPPQSDYPYSGPSLLPLWHENSLDPLGLLPYPSLDSDISSLNDGAFSTPRDSSTQHTDALVPSQFQYDFSDDVCYGMLSNVQIRLQKGRNIQTIKHSQPNVYTQDQAYLALTLRFDERRCDLFAIDADIEEPIATLNMKTFRLLDEIGDIRRLKYQALIPVETQPELKTDKKSENERTMGVNINVYGSAAVAESTGMYLAKEGLFFDEPDWIPDHVAYENPQVFKLPLNLRRDLGSQDGDLTALAQGETPATEDDAFDLDAFIDQLGPHEYLDQIDADDRIASELLRHQSEGVNFIERRETNRMPESRSLWERGEDESFDTYRHRITGSTSTVRNETLGGILADEMGLGKSLTMLAAILRSSDRAVQMAYKAMSSGLEPDAISSSCTLIVLPSALLMETWQDEINKHFRPGSLNCFKYHGYHRYRSQREQGRRIRIDYPELLMQNHIVFTTYGTLTAEHRRKDSLLHRIGWHRVILDEAHVIRNPATKQFEAVRSLKSRYRWCLTGTPIQNTIEDLGSVVRFLRTPILCEPPQFRRHITNKVQPSFAKITKAQKVSASSKKGDTTTEITDKADFTDLRVLLSSICLRRNKNVLPNAQCEEIRYSLNLSDEEKHGYERLLDDCNSALQRGVSGVKTREANQTVLHALLRLRIFCNNGFRGRTAMLGEPVTDPTMIANMLEQEDQAICAYCSVDVRNFDELNSTGSGCVTPCMRIVCGDCEEQHHERTKAATSCPLCDEKHDQQADPHHIAHGSNSADMPYPTKLLKLRDDILEARDESKSIVFSCWKKTLDIVCDILKECGVPYIRVDGDVPNAQRRAFLKKFHNDSDIRVLLMTLGTGAVGLNDLSVANRVHILEPQWNPSVESQAIGRVVRFGQEKPVKVIRYIMNDTVESSNVLKRQKRKILTAKGGFQFQVLKDLLYSTDQTDTS